MGTPKLTEPNPTTNALKKQEPYKMVFIPLVRKTLSFRVHEHIAVRLYSS
ncbi:cell division protein FtsH [Helicobacter pylori]|nr:cell division protein FtsH [Helicobacter pylori]